MLAGYNENMQKRLQRGLFFYLLSFLILLSNLAPAHAQVNERYFPETGHTISGKFLEFYEEVADPLTVFGYPITDAFQDPIYGWQVQYFEKARFELHPEEAADSEVKLTPLGRYLYKTGQARVLPANSPGCRTFKETEGSFQVCYAFLDFFNHYGGIEQFGRPISNLESQDGWIVQYFQNARFEWHPQLPSGQRVQLTDLGSLYFTQQAVDPTLLRQKDNLPQTILSLKVRAFTERPITSLKGRQTIQVVVRDQNLLPVANAQVSLRMQLPSGEWKELPQQVKTDSNGLAQFSIAFQTSQPALVILNITARWEDLLGQTTCFFRTWW